MEEGLFKNLFTKTKSAAKETTKRFAANSAVGDKENRLMELEREIGHLMIQKGIIPSDTEITDLCREGVNLRDEIVRHNQELDELRGFTRCPVCGERTTNKAQFCSVCGAKLMRKDDKIQDVLNQNYQVKKEQEKEFQDSYGTNSLFDSSLFDSSFSLDDEFKKIQESKGEHSKSHRSYGGSDTMLCMNCLESIPADAKICPICGASTILEQVSQKRKTGTK